MVASTLPAAEPVSPVMRMCGGKYCALASSGLLAEHSAAEAGEKTEAAACNDRGTETKRAQLKEF